MSPHSPSEPSAQPTAGQATSLQPSQEPNLGPAASVQQARPPHGAEHKLRVWDLPTRLFHWLLAVSVLASIATGLVGGNAVVWHFRLGYAAMALLAFRLLWGLVGGRWSRFASFIYAPGTLVRYLRGQSKPGDHVEVGHNPLGAMSVFAMLGVLIAQVATGLVADDEIANQGPLNKFVSSATAALATGWHKHWGFKIILALIALHLAAIAFYAVGQKRNLVKPMLTGDKPMPAEEASRTPASADGYRQRLLALALLVLCAAAVAAVVKLGG